jgi:hypothetical protein
MILSVRKSRRADASRVFVLDRLVQHTIVFLATSRECAAGNRNAFAKNRCVRSLYESTGQRSGIDNEILWINRTMTFQYQLYLPAGLDEVVDDPAIDQVQEIERLVKQDIREKGRDIPNVGRLTRLLSKYGPYYH